MKILTHVKVIYVCVPVCIGVYWRVYLYTWVCVSVYIGVLYLSDLRKLYL